MADVASFFEEINRRRTAILPSKVSGTLRFDVNHDGQVNHWLVAVKKGNVFVSRDEQEADVVLTIDADLFEEITSGEANLIAALLRNRATVEGSLPLLLAFRRALPGVPGAHDPRLAMPAGRERS